MSSSKATKIVAGYGGYPAYSGPNGDDPMSRWYSQEEPWNAVAPSTNSGSGDKKKDKKSKDGKSSKGHHGHHK